MRPGEGGCQVRSGCLHWQAVAVTPSPVEAHSRCFMSSSRFGKLVDGTVEDSYGEGYWSGFFVTNRSSSVESPMQGAVTAQSLAFSCSCASIHPDCLVRQTSCRVNCAPGSVHCEHAPVFRGAGRAACRRGPGVRQFLGSAPDPVPGTGRTWPEHLRAAPADDWPAGLLEWLCGKVVTQ